MPGNTPPREPRRCVYPPCAAEFVPYGNQVYCSSEHYRADAPRKRAERRNARATEPSGKRGSCALDGCEESARGDGVVGSFCSDTHYALDWRRRSGRVGVYAPRTCEYPPCRQQFTPRAHNQLYCQRAHKDADAYRRNPERTLRSQRRRRQANPAFAAEVAERARRWVAEHPEQAREHFRRATLRKRGLTVGGYEALLAEFAGACWLCRRVAAERTPTGRLRSLHVDHDHAHPVGDPAGVRGLLDTWCNTRLAIVEDTTRVQMLRDYLAARAAYLPPPAGPDDTRRGGRWTNFRLTLEQYAAMRAACADRCEACGRPERARRDGTDRPLSVDHDHAKSHGEPGFIRGLICNDCNSAIGVLENRDWWGRATHYLTWAPQTAQRLIAPHPLPPGRS